ncbi:3-deoxy-D-manno-octulosonic acid transferase [Marivivens marinus]|uniref:3-deoxy-D-manno-octulosonic acid transferase n=1 Tax=Marivivens marinus TaxID=3110173 RepID=UPI003B849660
MQHSPSDREIQHTRTGTPPAPVFLRLWRGLGRALPGVFLSAAYLVHARQGSAKERRPERAGRATIARPKGPLVWIHGASLGEVSQLRLLVPALQKDLGVSVLITTMTQTGADWVAAQLPDALHQFQPSDTAAHWNRFLDHWRPTVGLVIENDLWPTMLSATANHGIPVMMLNARLSRSFDRYPGVYRHLLGFICSIHCRNDAVAAQFDRLGYDRANLLVGGDLKAFGGALPKRPAEAAELKVMIGHRTTWIAASTHADDEPVVLSAARALKTQGGPLLVWAPRHPRRAPQIIAAAQAAGLTVAQRSQRTPIGPSTDIYLADTTGEMGTILALSDIVFLGGGFGTEGGHNPYEPAAEGKAILSGPRVRHFAEAFDVLAQSGAATFVNDAPGLTRAVTELSQDQRAKDAGRAAKQVIASMPNPIEAIVGMIRPFVPKAEAER